MLKLDGELRQTLRLRQPLDKSSGLSWIKVESKRSGYGDAWVNAAAIVRVEITLYGRRARLKLMDGTVEFADSDDVKRLIGERWDVSGDPGPGGEEDEGQGPVEIVGLRHRNLGVAEGGRPSERIECRDREGEKARRDERG